MGRRSGEEGAKNTHNFKNRVAAISPHIISFDRVNLYIYKRKEEKRRRKGLVERLKYRLKRGVVMRRVSRRKPPDEGTGPWTRINKR